MASQLVKTRTGKGILPLFQQALDAGLYNQGWEAAKLFRALIAGRNYGEGAWWRDCKPNPQPEHIRFSLMFQGDTPVAWTLQWLDTSYSFTGEYWRYTSPWHRNKGYQRRMIGHLERIKASHRTSTYLTHAA